MQVHRLLALTLLLAASAVAQTPPCLSFNDSNTTVSGTISAAGFSGQLYRAWQITPTAGFPVMAAQVYTRNQALSGDRYFILEIWTDAAGQPGTRLAGGTWKVVTSRPFAWQGANLDAPVVLLPNTPYWVVFIEVGGSNFPVEPGGATVVPEMRSSNGTTWIVVGTSAPKIRLFCGLLDDANSVPFGSGCTSSGGRLPSVFTNEQPTLGNATFFFEMSGLPTGAPVFLVLGIDTSFVSVPAVGLPAGCAQNTDILEPFLYFAGTGNTRGPTCDGYARHVVAIPSMPNLVGFTVAAQAVPYDSGATSPLPFVSSNAQRITIY
jgi:hypothetical protein